MTDYKETVEDEPEGEWAMFRRRARKIRNEGKWREIYVYILNFNTVTGSGPSVRNLCLAMGISSISTMYGYIDRMQRAGWLYRTEDEHAWLCACPGKLAAQTASQLQRQVF